MTWKPVTSGGRARWCSSIRAVHGPSEKLTESTGGTMTELMTSYVSAFGGHLATPQVAAVGILVVGIVETLATDLWQRLLQVLFGLPPANWGLIGRWLA